MSDLVFFITGTSTGFGRELTIALNEAGHKVIASARNIDKIKDLGELANVSTLQLDIGDKKENIEKKAQEAIGIHGYVTHLVNNAGYSAEGAFEEVSENEARLQFEVNVWGTINVTNAFLPHFRSRKSGFIATISSLVGIVSFPGLPWYCSTKFALEGLFEALKAEVAHLGIKVLLINPGYFATNFLDPNNIKPPTNRIDDYKPITDAMTKNLRNQHTNQLGDPKKGAVRIIEALTGTGMAKGRELPTRLLLGSDSYQLAIGKGQNLVDSANEWKDVSISTDRTDK